MDRPVQAGGLDAQGDGAVAQHAAEAGIVLVKNTDGVLPLASGGARRVAVIGGHADLGVLSGGGSPQAVPIGSISFPAPDVAPSRGGGHVFHPSPLLAALRTRGGQVTFDPGADPAGSVAAARAADLKFVGVRRRSAALT